MYTKYLKNPYIRIVVAAGVIILITICLNTKDYMGAGSGLIARAIENGEAGPLDFLWKMLLTALTMAEPIPSPTRNFAFPLPINY